MAQIILLVDRFYAIRKLLETKKYYTNRRNNSSSYDSLYSRQRARKREQRELFKNDPRFKEFFTWIFDIQKRLDVNDKEFARLCGVNKQTISMWRNFNHQSGGIFPSKASFERLLRLEVMSDAKVITIKNKSKNIIIPKRKIRLQANVQY